MGRTTGTDTVVGAVVGALVGTTRTGVLTTVTGLRAVVDGVECVADPTGSTGGLYRGELDDGTQQEHCDCDE